MEKNEINFEKLTKTIRPRILPPKIDKNSNTNPELQTIMKQFRTRSFEKPLKKSETNLLKGRIRKTSKECKLFLIF